MKKYMFLACVIISLFASTQVFAASYTWSVSSGDWGTATNWTPNRTTPATDDILIFSGMSEVTATAMPTETIGQLIVTSNCTANIGSAVAAVLTLSTTTSSGLNALQIDAGSVLYYFGPYAKTITILTACKGAVNGDVVFTSTGASIANRLLAIDTDGLTFNNGATFQLAPGGAGAGNPFGSTYLNSVRFKSGATFYMGGTKTGPSFATGSNPFGATQPNSVLVMDPGSIFYTWCSIFVTSGRTYGNVIIDSRNANISNTAGTGTFTVNGYFSIKSTSIGKFIYTDTSTTGSNGLGMLVTGDFTIESGASGFSDTAALTGASNIEFRGNIYAASTCSLSTNTNRTYLFSGSSPQTITLLVPPSSMPNLKINNAAGITVSTSLAVTGTVTMTAGNIDLGANTITVGTSPSSAGTIIRTTGTIIGSVNKWQPIGISTTVYPIGTATDYTPITLTINSIDTVVGNNTTAIKASVTDAKHASAPSTYFISRYFSLTPGSGISTITADIVLEYTATDSTDANLGSNWPAAQIAKWNGASWTYIPAMFGYDATNSLYVAITLGQTSLSDWTVSGPGGTPAELSRFNAILKP
ncbi:MAG: hypothetical protein ACE14V_09340 [bacterium]